MSRISRPVRVALILIGIGIAPFVSVALAGMIASANDCVLNEAAAHPCIVFGRDIGELLYTMAVMGWLMLVSIFFLLGGMLVLLGEVLRAMFRILRRR